MEPRQRASPEQFSIIIDFMERHGDLARPQAGPQGRLRSDQLWQNISDILNSIGGGVQKSPDKWKKVWADWKTKTKKKYLNLRLQASRTGGGPSRKIHLNALEERVVAVIGVSAVAGQAGVQEQGFHCESAVDLPLEHAQYPNDSVLEDNNSPNIPITTYASPALASVPLPVEDTQAQSPSQPTQSPPVPQPVPATQLAPQPPPAPQPPLPRTPPRRRQASGSPHSRSITPRRALLRVRRNRGLTPFERAADLFADIERRRLVHEEARDKRLHEREMERIAVTRQQNALLHQLSVLAQQLIDVISQQRPSSLPSTDPI